MQRTTNNTQTARDALEANSEGAPASPRHEFSPSSRLQSKVGICTYLGRISSATYDAWQAKGIVPGPVPGTNRYDIKQHDHVLDTKLGLQPERSRKLSPLEEWERCHGQLA